MYLILTQNSTDYAKAWSRALYRLSRPDHVRDPADVTLYLCGWITHPDGRVALDLGDADCPVHAEADTAAFTRDLPVSASDRSKAKAGLDGRKGGRARVTDLLPDGLKGNLRTREEMEADGWFPDPE